MEDKATNLVQSGVWTWGHTRQRKTMCHVCLAAGSTAKGQNGSSGQGTKVPFIALEMRMGRAMLVQNKTSHRLLIHQVTVFLKKMVFWLFTTNFCGFKQHHFTMFHYLTRKTGRCQWANSFVAHACRSVEISWCLVWSHMIGIWV